MGDIRILVKTRGVTKAGLTRLYTYLKDNKDTLDFDDLQIKKIKLEELKESFNKIQLDIDLLIENDDDQTQESVRIDFEKNYHECAKIINQGLRNLNTASAPSNNAASTVIANNSQSNLQQNNSLLPKIQIRPFDGSPIEWCSFHDTFKTLVHDDQSIPAVQKFHLLKNALRGDLTTIMETLTASEENYTVAWDILNERCDRRRQIVNTHLKLLLDLPEVKEESPSQIRSLREKAQMHVNALKALDQPVHMWDTFLVFIISQKLDKITKRTWDRTLEANELPKYCEFMKFLSKQERCDESEIKSTHGKPNGSKFSRNNYQNKFNKKSDPAQSFIAAQQTIQCIYCQESHIIYKCAAFLKLNPRDRGNIIRERKLCINCFKDNHNTYKCLAPKCKICGRKHNTLLHFSDSNKNVDNNEVSHQKEISDYRNVEINNSTSNNANAEAKKVSLTVMYDSEVFLGTARVKILDKFNNEHECRVLLDGCSQVHFITEKLANKLNLHKEKFNAPFAGLGQLETRAQYKVETTIRSKTTSYQSKVQFVALPTITGLLPARKIDKRIFEIPSNITLADPEFDKPAEIDVLLGTTLFYKLLSIGQIKLVNHSVILQKTLLGWIVTGEVQYPLFKPTIKTCNLITTLDKQISKFWEIEEIPHKKFLSKEENECENIYNESTKRDSTGRYIVQLPFNDKKDKLGNSYNMALKRFYSLEKRLNKNPIFKQQYFDALKEYVNLGHMTEITHFDDKNEGYYIPHQAVIKSDSLTTKLRIVFDASAKTSTNVSLNDILLTGPVVQDELIFILLRFRMHNVVLTADLKQMYRQIKVETDHAKYQKILLREKEDQSIRVFRLDTVTQGTASASYLASKTLQKLADDEGYKFPSAAYVLKNDFYMDDVLTGAETLAKASQLKHDLTKILKLGGFELHKWSSNYTELIDNHSDIKNENFDLNNEYLTKVLGINWNSLSDLIKYNIKSLPIAKRVTKRVILSEIAQLFDPLGLLGPVVILAKLLMQDLWKLKLDWDESVPQNINDYWSEFKRNLLVLNQFQVARHAIFSSTIDIQLHGFCDASDKAYGACIYIRSTNSNNQHKVTLICAKSRVAPLKTVCIPRLELCAAVLLVKLFKTTVSALKITFSKIRLWSDSTIVLTWIKKSPHLLKTFVANRVAEIQTVDESIEWYHVSTNDNPADFISRGQNASEFLKNRMWLQGPEWLELDESEWHIAPINQIEVPELRTKVTLTVNEIQSDILNRFSTINALNRFVALCLRLINRIKNKNRVMGPLTPEELHEAHKRIIILVQKKHFVKEINELIKEKTVNSRSKLNCLSPFIDESGILRVGGRIKNAPMNFSQKYPIVLPKSDNLTHLIIRNEHLKQWHAGTQATLNSVRQNYWPLDGKNTTRHIIMKCVACTRVKPVNVNYLMGNLPETRLIQTRPFLNVGIDYCGYFLLKEKKYRNTKTVKSYVVVFVCFSTKAVHLELVSDLTTESCLQTIKRFISRRGIPQNIYSDNATNFIGVKNEIMKIRALLSSNTHNKLMSQNLADQSIKWHFSPPRSPHFGGLWEAAVKSFKHHLYRTVGQTLFTYEQFNTCIIQIESILNSRPLIPMSSDPNDPIALTPAHFLIGDSLKSVPEEALLETQENRLSLWQRINQIKQHFWKRWHKEYLNELRTRSKWHKGNGSQIKIGTLVTIKEENLPPMQWSTGRIVELHPGADNIVRVATVKTNNGLYKRCVKNLCPLPINIE